MIKISNELIYDTDRMQLEFTAPSTGYQLDNNVLPDRIYSNAPNKSTTVVHYALLVSDGRANGKYYKLYPISRDEVAKKLEEWQLTDTDSIKRALELGILTYA